MTRLRDANALVTGASRGIGPIIAEALAAEGANLVLSARSQGPLETLATSLERYGVGTRAIATDLTDP